MPKSRHRPTLNRKQVRNAKRRAEDMQNFNAATQVRMLAEKLPNQEALDTCLRQEKNIDKRLAMFTFMEPYISFPDPQMPLESGIIRPHSGLILKP